MSTQIFPLAVWQSGTNENSIPANDNALRVQVLMGPAVDFTSAAPSAPSEDDQYIIGTSWGGFTSNNVVIYKGGNFLEFDAFEGWVKVVDGSQYFYDGSAWQEGSGGGGGGVNDSVTAITISSGSATADLSGGKKNFTLSMTGNATFSVTGLAGAGKVSEFDLEIKQDATGSRTLTLPSSFKALGGSDIAISSTANSVTVISAKTFDNGANWRYAMQESA